MLSTAIFLAWRSLGESRLTLVFLVGAVAAGVGFQIPNTANLDGYEAELTEHGIRSGFGAVRVRPASVNYMENSSALASRLQEDERVSDIVVALSFPGAAGKRGNFRGAPLFGVDMSRTALPFRLAGGMLLQAGDHHGVIVGSSVASRLGLELGDEVQVRAIFVTAAQGSALDEDAIGAYTMTVRGFAAGTFGAAQGLFVDHGFLAEESGLRDAATMIVLYLHDNDTASVLADEIDAQYEHVDATTWMDDDSFIGAAIQSTRILGYVSQSMVGFAVAIPVLALLYIHVLHRRREIGLLSAIGFGPMQIFWVFLSQAAIIGVIGIALGCGLGYGIILYFQHNAIFEWNGFVISPVVSWAAFVQPALVVFAVTVVAGVYPAWRAARVDPALVLRGVT